MADQYIFVASGDACAICAALDGQTSATPTDLPHDNCQCQVLPTGEGDCPSYTTSGGASHRYGPHGGSFTYGVEISVTCCDGSEIGESVEIDMGNEGAYEDVLESIDGRVEAEAQALADQCPAGGPDAGPNVS